MGYFNPKIYNKENLRENDRKELEYWHEQISELLDREKPDDDYPAGSETQ